MVDDAVARVETGMSIVVNGPIVEGLVNWRRRMQD